MLKTIIVLSTLVSGISIGISYSNYDFEEQPIAAEVIDILSLDDEAEVVKSLDDCADVNLQATLEAVLDENPEFKKLIRNKKLSVGLVDLRNDQDAKFAQVNGREMLYAASLPKIAVLLAAMDAIDSGLLEETAEVKADMKLMIAKSDNRASTRMIDRVGFDHIAKVLQDEKYKLYDIERGGGLWVGKRYAAAGKRNPDPMMGLSHAATTEQVCRFYYMMSQGQLVTKERSAQMMDIMLKPKLHHKFVNTLDKIAPGAKLYRKSGSWSSFHSDSILVDDGKGRKYILVGLVDSTKGEQIMRKLVYSAEKALAQSAS